MQVVIAQGSHRTDNLLYDGSQLRSLWIREHFGYLYEKAPNYGKGDAICVWVGPADVRAHMVDMDDVVKKDYIKSREMLHFIVEIFGATLPFTVAMQRLLVVITVEALKGVLQENRDVVRNHDDILGLPRILGKLSVSIATVSPVSGLIHMGLNTKSGPEEGVKVKTCGLEDVYGLSRSHHPPLLEYQGLIANIVEPFRMEYESIRDATRKVKGVP